MSETRAFAKSIVFQCSALAILAIADVAQALPIVNGSFAMVGSTRTGSYAISTTLANDLPGWTVGPYNGFLDCLTFPGTATTDGCGNGLQMWGGSAFPAHSPDGGNFILFDGDCRCRTLSQTITGLVPNQSYVVSFFQAAAQQIRFDGITTEQWRVSLGNEAHDSQLMTNASHGFLNWRSQSLTFRPISSTATLRFLALGTPGTEPPFVLLDGVSITAAPEPATYTLVGVGLAGVLVARRRRQRRASASSPADGT